MGTPAWRDEGQQQKRPCDPHPGRVDGMKGWGRKEEGRVRGAESGPAGRGAVSPGSGVFSPGSRRASVGRLWVPDDGPEGTLLSSREKGGGGSTGKQPVASVHPPPRVTTEGERPGGRGRAMESSPPTHTHSPEALMQNQGSHEALAIQTKQGRASRRAVAWKCCFRTVSSSRLDLMHRALLSSGCTFLTFT